VIRPVELLARLTTLDRRWLFLAMAVVIVVPLVFPIGLPITPQQPVIDVYEAVRALPPGSKVLLSADYDPASNPELQPFMEAFLELAFSRDLSVVAIALWPQGPRMAKRSFDAVAPKYGKVYGMDYANLGFKEGKIVVMTKVGESLVNTFPVDDAGTPVRALPVMRDVERLGDFSLLVLVGSGFPGPYEWVPQVQGRFIDRIVAATTSVMAPDLIPFLGSGQLVGLVGGMSGAAQFEQLVGIEGGIGSRGMDAQSFAHLLIILAIVLANVAWFTSGRRQRGGT
jgi:hypothetical protein